MMEKMPFAYTSQCEKYRVDKLFKREKWLKHQIANFLCKMASYIKENR